VQARDDGRAIDVRRNDERCQDHRGTEGIAGARRPHRLDERAADPRPRAVPPADVRAGVGDAIRAYRNAPDDPELAGLLALFGSTERLIRRFRRRGNHVVALDEHGREFLRVPAKEPTRVLQALDEKQGILRSNVT
jgi:hypothetical protein